MSFLKVRRRYEDMLEKGRIGVRQFTILVILVTIGDSIFILPAISAFEAKQDAWIAGIVGCIAGLLIALLLCAVGKLYPRLNLIEYNEKILGKWIGTAVNLLFLGYVFISAVWQIREIGNFMTIVMMPETPIIAIHILFLSVIIMAVRLGIEPFARAGEIFIPWFILLLLFFIISIIPQTEVYQMLPIIEEGFKPVLRGSLTAASFPFAELVVFLMIFPYVNQPHKVNSSFLLGALLGGLVLVAIIFLCIIVLGADIMARQLFPVFTLAKKVGANIFWERTESILAFLWIITAFFKITLYYYVFNIGLAQVFKLKEYRMLTLPSGLVLLTLSLIIAPNITYFNHLAAKYWSFFNLTYSVFLPLLLLAVYALRRKLKL